MMLSLTNKPPIRVDTLGVSSVTSAQAGDAKDTPAEVATAPPINDAVLASESLLEMAPSFGTENAEVEAGDSVRKRRVEIRTMLLLLDLMCFVGCSEALCELSRPRKALTH